MIRPPVHTNPSRKWSFWKMLFKVEGIENAGLMHFSVGRKHFENGAF